MPLGEDTKANGRPPGVEASLLKSLIETSHIPPAERPVGEYSFLAGNRALDTCALAERSFARTLKTFRALQRPWAMLFQKGVRLVVDDDGQALFLQKSGAVSSALSLKPIDANGFRYPAGMITRLDLTEQHSLKAPAREVSTVPVSDVVSVSPLRLSLFALPPEERCPWLASWSWRARPRRAVREQLEISAIAAQAQRAADRLRTA